MNTVGSSVNLHIIKDGKILLLRRISQRWMNGKLQIPGGHTEHGESPTEAIVREANEELGIDIATSDVKYAGTVFVSNGENEYFAIQFQLIDPNAHEYKIMEPEKCSELVWATISNLPDDTIAIFKDTVNQLQDGSQYLEIAS